MVGVFVGLDRQVVYYRSQYSSTLCGQPALVHLAKVARVVMARGFYYGGVICQYVVQCYRKSEYKCTVPLCMMVLHLMHTKCTRTHIHTHPHTHTCSTHTHTHTRTHNFIHYHYSIEIELALLNKIAIH